MKKTFLAICAVAAGLLTMSSCSKIWDEFDAVHGEIDDLKTRVEALEAIIKESTQSDTLTVIITKSPCVLLKGQKFPNKCVVEADLCRKCGACTKIGCPAISKTDDGKVTIDATMCNGCGLCMTRCKFGAIKLVEKEGN